MHDPFFEPWKPLSDFIRPAAEYLNLYTLPLHIHEVIFAFVTYHLVFLASPIVSSKLFPAHYPKLKPRTQINWDVHVVSFVQATFISALALYQIFFNKARSEEEHRVYGYTGLGGAGQAFALGYFLWDLWMSSKYFDIFGFGFLAHAISAVVVYSLGFRPFVNYYSPVFILFELSSPFLNIHWFCDKLNLTGSKLQWYNGMCLLAAFFMCRIVWGPIQSYYVFCDIFEAVRNPPLTREEGVVVPSWLAFLYLGSNITLNSLNYFWFSKMIDAVTKRFREPAVTDGRVVVEGSKVVVPPVKLETKKEL